MSVRGLSIALATALVIAVGGAQSGSGHKSAFRPAQRAARHPSTDPGFWGPGSWCWFADPRAVRIVGHHDRTYVGWIDWQGNVEVGQYDANFGLMRRFGVGRLFHDDHGSPAILVEPDRRLTVFWSGHGGPAIYYRSTRRPEDISVWGPVQRLPITSRGSEGFTYPNPVLLPAERNRLYLFWRGPDWSADYATRSPTGRWSADRELIRNPGQRPYVKVDSDGHDALALAFTDGHPRNGYTSIFYAAYRAGRLWHADGRSIRRLGAGPIAPRQADVVYDARKTHVSSWVWDVALDARGPVIVYATFPTTRDHAYWYARWDGERWISHFLTFAGPSISPMTREQQYSGGIALDHSDPSTVYVSVNVNGTFEIERWSTPDGGITWTHTTVVRTLGADAVRPLVPRGAAAGPMGLLWLSGRYGGYQRYRTDIAFVR